MKYNAVRRLTPLECERLQGFPDGWTDIGEWTDSKGKKRQCTDGARYKALGNSIALPFWKVLAKRISAQYDRDITLGSLFDGIGGFPLVFEQINGRGTARWASEIEEFPIAVTERRFGEKPQGEATTPEAFEAAMKEIRDGKIDDPEGMHIEADYLLCDLLEQLGYGAGVAIFKVLEKWYS